MRIRASPRHPLWLHFAHSSMIRTINFDISAAGGFYKGQNAFALGAFYRPNRNVMLSMGTTLTSGDNAYNVGVTFKIGKSGKHTEAGLTTADLYAMIGAMQDKMDQQQKKIEELEAKQAK